MIISTTIVVSIVALYVTKRCLRFAGLHSHADSVSRLIKKMKRIVRFTLKAKNKKE
jgi:hypothetical protein